VVDGGGGPGSGGGCSAVLLVEPVVPPSSGASGSVWAYAELVSRRPRRKAIDRLRIGSSKAKAQLRVGSPSSDEVFVAIR
jgi:hypothetical protein